MRGALIAGVMATACSAGGSDIGKGSDGAAPMVDAGSGAHGDAAIDAPRSAIETCFPPSPNATKPHPNYDQFNPVVNADCTGTNYQDITGVERVVFLGDSITTGTPPTLPTDFYRSRVENAMRAKFGWLIDVQDCSNWGARTDDFLGPPHEQIHSCFSDVETRKTLIVMTMGGNDMSAIAKEAAEGDTPAQSMAKVDLALSHLEEAVTWLTDPAHFPNGSYVVFSNIYEFTDATGDLASCPAASLAGFDAVAAPQMTPAYLHSTEQYLRIAVEHHVDMVFALENFCGHGFHSNDPNSVCYRGPDTERWFDLTCIHPNPTGHEALAGLFTTTIAE
ncbi:MAG TPA: SGNH/GDSL hydrolase family protein [Kofleriaceae bacterium]|nr:SGNH/GDSL hydrolase family protein [Kofleriaceae bacterium]